MNIKDLDLSEYVIKTSSEYEDFKNDIKTILPQIEQNYSNEKSFLVNFITHLEEVYKEHPEINKISFDYNQNTSCEDAMHNLYIYYFDFEIRNEDTNEAIKSKSAKAFNSYVEDMFSEMISNEDSSPELGIDTIQKMEEALFFDTFKNISRDDRFNIYREMTEFSYFNNTKSIHNIIDSLEKNENISTEYEKVKFLHKEIDIQTINFKGNYFSLDVGEPYIQKIKNSLESIESSYIISNVKEMITRNNLDTNNPLKIEILRKDTSRESYLSKDRYLNYTVQASDEENKTVKMDVNFIFNKFLPEKVTEKDVIFKDLDGVITSRLFSFKNTGELKERFPEDEKIRENNYTDISKFISNNKKSIEYKKGALRLLFLFNNSTKIISNNMEEDRSSKTD